MFLHLIMILVHDIIGIVFSHTLHGERCLLYGIYCFEAMHSITSLR